MSSLSFEVCQERLKNYLGQKYPQYLKLIKEFVQARLSLDEVDSHARKYFDSANVTIHRDYFTALLNKLQKADRGANISKRPPVKRRKITKSTEQFRDVYVEKLPPVLELDKKKRESLLEMSTTCANEGLLPENWMICGRLLSSGLEQNIVDVTDDAVNIMALGTRIFLKNIIDSMLMKVGKHRPDSDQHSTRPGWLCDMGLIPEQPTIFSFLKDKRPFLFSKEPFLSKLKGKKEKMSNEQLLMRSETASLSMGGCPYYEAQSSPPFCITMKHVYRFLLAPQKPCPAPQLKSLQTSFDLIPHHFLRSFCLERASLFLSKHHHLAAASQLPEQEALQDHLLLMTSSTGTNQPGTSNPPPSKPSPKSRSASLPNQGQSSSQHGRPVSSSSSSSATLQHHPVSAKQRRVAVTLGSPFSSPSKVITQPPQSRDDSVVVTSVPMSKPIVSQSAPQPAPPSNVWIYDEVSP